MATGLRRIKFTATYFNHIFMIQFKFVLEFLKEKGPSRKNFKESNFFLFNII